MKVFVAVGHNYEGQQEIIGIYASQVLAEKTLVEYGYFKSFLNGWYPNKHEANPIPQHNCDYVIIEDWDVIQEDDV